MPRLSRIRQSRYLPPLVLLLWGWLLVWSSMSARLDLLLNAVFHPVVAIAGVVLMVLGAIQLRSAPRLKTSLTPLSWLVSVAVALLVLLFPPSPSFSDLAANRSEILPEAPRLSFFLPPEQRTLTEWVRLLRSQPDPDLHAGDPVRISGFVLQRPGMQPQLARLTVRCCLADATRPKPIKATLKSRSFPIDEPKPFGLMVPEAAQASGWIELFWASPH